jgi:hypothetical protein
MVTPQQCILDALDKMDNAVEPNQSQGKEIFINWQKIRKDPVG